MELAAASSSDATISSAAESNYESPVDSVVEDVVVCNNPSDDEDDNNAAVIVAISSIVPTVRVHGSDKNNGCIECSTPSNHVCRKCKKCVCSLCCAEKRALENAWWCDLCFKTQSVANQQLIRDGSFYSDDE
jgi:hypothetical protein